MCGTVRTTTNFTVECSPGLSARCSVLTDSVNVIEDATVYIPTGRAGVTLRALTPDDAGAYESAMKANAAHLTRHGDYLQEVEKAASEYVKEFETLGPALVFGICEREELVGSIALVPVAPPQYGLGYWLAESA